MDRRFAVCGALVFALAAVVAMPAPARSAPPGGATNSRAWPTNYETTPMMLSALLANVRAAHGNTIQRSSAVYEEHGGGLLTIEHDRWSGDDYRVDEKSGPFETSYGMYHGQRWELGPNGYTLLKRGLHQRSEANARALEHADSSDAVTLLGRLRAPIDTYVIRVAPADGRKEIRFYDAASFALVRREVVYPDLLSVTTYGDFRTVHGTTLAYHITTSDGHPENDDDVILREITFDEPIADDALSIPAGRRAPVEFPSGVHVVRLPAHITPGGAIIVRVSIAGRGLDFQLDSGASSLVVDTTVAKSLGLPIYGKWKETVAGSFIGGRTIVPELKIGAITMRDIAIDTVPFSYQSGENEKVVGLLGFDFIAGGIIKIDYENGTVDAMTYESPLPADAILADVVLDDAVPMVPVEFNGALGEHFILDTGAHDVMLFSGYSKRNLTALKEPADVKARDYFGYFPLVSGVGGTLSIVPYIAHTIRLGPYAFKNFPALIMTGQQPAFEGEDTDGLVGASMLSAFDVYLDYANSRIAFVLNESGKKGHAARGGFDN